MVAFKFRIQRTLSFLSLSLPSLSSISFSKILLMAEISCVKEIQEEDVDKNRLLTRPELDVTDHKEQTVNEEDGCKTPTSSPHKIPAALCPPAPRKPKPNRSSGMKRKLTSVHVVNRIPIDLSPEIEMFFEELDRRIKKSRKQ
ncbi:cyclin-dependent protein kinase inhibitor SMR3-like [Brassica napus]|uniref:cyclin-dependent protein kinase inhibitor SMR3-like n=1 Tax=Brassica napus TaxID=3708 RepID=UPI002079AFFD|nr:cyclin-dependent protein kinase inhibitor SMR3-like [Brassica napus]